MITYFSWRGVEYEVSGWIWANDGEQNGLIVNRVDGRAIRGVKMHAGMIQTGLSRGLKKAAEQALERERAQRKADR